MDDALRIERVLRDESPPWLEPFFATSTSGSLKLHLNSNEVGRLIRIVMERLEVVRVSFN